MTPAMLLSGALLSAAVTLMVLGLVGLAAVLWEARAMVEGRG